MKTCWLQYLLWLIIASLGVVSVLSACGQKGQLYRPTAQVAPPVADGPVINADSDNNPPPSSTTKKP